MYLNFHNNKSNKKTERFLKFLTVVLVALAVFLGNYLWTRRNAALQQASILDSSLISRFDEAEGEKKAPSLRLVKLTGDDSRFAVMSDDGREVLYYVPSSGEIKAVLPDGKDGAKLMASLPTGALDASWSDDRKSLILDHQGTVKFFDLESGRSRSLPNIIDPSFSPDQDRVVYVSFDDEKKEGGINVSGVDFESFKRIVPTRSAKWQLEWIVGDTVSMFKPDERRLNLASLYTLDVKTGKLVQAVPFLSDLQYVWSKSAGKLLYSNYDERDEVVRFQALNLSNGNKIKIDLNTTARKCIWLGDEVRVYCAVREAGGDSFYIINTESGENEKIFAPDINVDAVDLMLSPGEKYLIFRNLNNNRLYSLLLTS